VTNPIVKPFKVLDNMTPQEIKDHIDKIINNSFSQIQKVYDNQREDSGSFNHIEDSSRLVFPIKRDSRLVFPLKRDTSTRISEQELRFIFVEEFNRYCAENGWDAFYSIETPTRDEYRFSDGDGKKQSAMFDLTIFSNKGERICAIEFKALNPDTKCYAKDFEKLNNSNEKIGLTYFVQLFKKVDKSTVSNLRNVKLSKKGQVIYRCYALEGDNNLTRTLSNNTL